MAQLPPTRTAAAHHRPDTHPTRDEPNRLTPPASPASQAARQHECPDLTGRNPAQVYDAGLRPLKTPVERASSGLVTAAPRQLHGVTP